MVHDRLPAIGQAQQKEIGYFSDTAATRIGQASGKSIDPLIEQTGNFPRHAG